MQAIIMAGGEGTRLRPITCSMPKPMVPLCGRPALEYILELLALHGVTDAAVSLMYQGEKISAHFSENQFAGVSLSFVTEEAPLGTAGGAKLAYDKVTSDKLSDKVTIVISGDALCDFDLSKAVAFHKSKNAAATIITKQVEDTREYGVICNDEAGRVVGFSEKPSAARATSCLANTGVYILSPEVWELIPAGKKLDFAGDVFPAMLEKKLSLYHYEEQGYWCDIGDIGTYISGQADMLSGKVKLPRPVPLTDGSFVSPTSRIERGAMVHAGSVIGDGVYVGRGAKIIDSIIMPGAFIADNATVSGGVVCAGARVLRGAGVYETAVVGEHAEVGANATVPPGVKVWNNKKVLSGDTLKSNLKYGYSGDKQIGENGFFGEIGAEISPSVAVRIGGALGSLPSKSGKREDFPSVGIGYADSPAAKALCDAVAAGVMSAGGKVFDFGPCFRVCFEFCMQKSGGEYGVFIDVSPFSDVPSSPLEPTPVNLENACFAKIIPTNSFGFPLPRIFERRVELSFNKDDFRQVNGDGFGERVDLSALSAMYSAKISGGLENTPPFERFVLQSVNPQVQRVLERVAPAGISYEDSAEDIASSSVNNHVVEHVEHSDIKGFYAKPCTNELHISPDGRRLSALVYKAGRKDVKYIPAERIFAFLCDDILSRGEDVAVPYYTTHLIDDIAHAYGQRVYRFHSCPSDENEDREACKVLVGNPFSRDGIMQLVMLINLLSSHKMRLIDAIETVPEIIGVRRSIAVHSNPAAIIARFGRSDEDGEGVTIYKRGGEVNIRPAKAGKSILMFAACEKVEFAKEIFAEVEERVRKLDRAGPGADSY